MSEEKVEETQEDSGVEFAVLLIKKEGELAIQPVNNLPQPENIDELYAAICLLKRNMEINQFAQIMSQVMTQVAAAANGQRESGIILPK